MLCSTISTLLFFALYLVVGRIAASTAALFANRMTSKCYVAVVFGHIDPSHFPLLTSEEDTTSLTKRGGRLYYRPSHAFFQDYKRELSKREVETLTDLEKLLLSLPWSAVKGRPDLRGPFDDMAKADKDRALRVAKRAEEEEAKAQAAREVYRRPGDEPNAFVVEADLYEVGEDATLVGPRSRNDTMMMMMMLPFLGWFVVRCRMISVYISVEALVGGPQRLWLGL